MKKNISRNPLWPDWYNGKKIDEVQFGRAFLEQWPLKCVNGTLYTLDGPVEDESEIKQRILENIEEYVTSGLSKKVTNILETIKLLAFSDPFPIEQDCIHLQNGVYHLPDGSFQESRLFCQNRLPVRYDPKAASPDRWLTFLHELLDDADIPTLQEYLGYCLIPSTKGQKMMLIVGKGGEGKSRIGLVLKRLMGDAASNGSVQKVENNRFARADLERRLLMIDDDMDMNALPKTNYIKTIVTAEAKLDLERKGVQSYQRDIYARFLCFGNGALTSLYDHSDGFFRRQLILTTKDKPADRTDDPFLVEKMCAELEGILLWCLEGLHRLVQNDFRFTVSPKAAANVDTPGDGVADEGSLRGSSEVVAKRIQGEIQKNVTSAGIEIIEARITYLAYAPEIAAVMLQRQQASAIIDARKMIVDGAVGMVEMALDRLNENKVVELDDERKAAMVSNLLVVLCGNRDAQPIVNSGSLY